MILSELRARRRVCCIVSFIILLRVNTLEQNTVVSVMYTSFRTSVWGGPLPKDVDWKEYLTQVIETSRALYARTREVEFMRAESC